MPERKPIELSHPQTLARMTDITEELERLKQRRDKGLLTDDEAANWSNLRGEFDELNEHRVNLEQEADLAHIRSAWEGARARTGSRAGVGRVERGTTSYSGDGYDLDPFLNPDSVEEKRFKNPWDLSGVQTYNRSTEEVTSEYRSRALCAAEKMPGANDKIRSAATSIIERWDDEDGKLSRLCLALSEPTYLRSWIKLARNPMSADLSADERQSVHRVQTLARAMSLTDAAGGYLVPFQLDPTVIITANGSVNQIRRAAREVVAIGDVWNGVSSGAVAWSYDAEAAEVSDDATTFAQPTIPIYKAQGFVPISIEAFQDAANVTAEIGRLLAFGRDVLEANAFSLGTGTGMPTGIVTALVGTSSVVTSAVADTFGIADVYALEGALPARYSGSPSTAWLANRLIYNRIRQFDTAGGAGLWAQLGDGMPAGLLDHQALISEDMDGVINAAAENYVAVYGDFDNYVIADRIGMTVEFVPHLFGTNRRPTNQRGWLAYVRHGADSVNDAAFRLLNVT